MFRLQATFSTVLVVIILFAYPGQVRAATDTWLAASDGLFHDDAMWTDGSAPIATDTANFTVPGDYRVFWDDVTADRTNQGLTLSAGVVTFAVSGVSPHTWAIHNTSNGADATLTFGTLNLGLDDPAYTGQLFLDIDDLLTINSDATLNVLSGNRVECKYIRIGDSSAGTMSIRSGGQLNNTSTSYIAYAAGSSGQMTVDGTGSTWTNASSLYVGRYGNGRLTISNGAAVSNTSTYIAQYAGSTSSVTVSGQHSSWAGTSTTYIGYSGNATLEILDGASASNGSTVHVAYSSGSSADITVRGQDSSWTCSSNLNLGYASTANMQISQGAHVSNAAGYLGYNTGSSGSVAVDGPDSTWTNSSDLYVGRYGNGVLDISNGAYVSCAKAYLGNYAGSSGSVAVDGADSIWRVGTSVLHTCYIGYQGQGSLQVTNGAGVLTRQSVQIGSSSGSIGQVTIRGKDSRLDNGFDIYVGMNGNGTLTIDQGGQVNTGVSLIGYGSNSVSHATIAGAGSQWTNFTAKSSTNLFFTVGYYGQGNLDISDGGQVTTRTDCSIGYEAGSSGNVSVDGTDSLLSSEYLLYVGYKGAGTLAITNGAQVSNAGTGILAYEQNSSGNVTVDGAGSIWNCGGQLTVGRNGDGQLSIGNGGQVNSESGLVGYFNGSGSVTVDGAGSIWNNISELSVSWHGNMDITAGGVVNSENSFVAFGFVNVDGAGSTWNCTGELSVQGESIEGVDPLTITGGGQVNSTGGSIGREIDVVGAVTVSGENSAWQISERLVLGDEGVGTLTIHSGGRVSCGVASLGIVPATPYFPIEGHLFVDGAGSVLDCSGSLTVGEQSVGTMAISNGGQVNCTYGRIAYFSDANGSVSVDGEGSAWNCSATLVVGNFYGTASLDITGGAHVNSNVSAIGLEEGSTGFATVDGTGSLWQTDNELYIGSSGQGTLNIINGGQVIAGDTYLDQYNTASTIHFNGGTLTCASFFFTNPQALTGAGTVVTHGWMYDQDITFDAANDPAAPQQFIYNSEPDQNVTVDLTFDGSGFVGVGLSGVAAMNILDGRQLNSTRGYISYRSGSEGTVTVHGPGSTWTNSDTLYVGYGGTGTLLITGCGQVASQDGYVGVNAGSTGSVTVDGEDSHWACTGQLIVGYLDSGHLMISQGGQVTCDSAILGKYWDLTSLNAGGWVTVDGAGSLLHVAGNLNVGYDSLGQLTIANGGRVEADTVLVDSYQNGSRVMFDGGTLAANTLISGAQSLFGVGTVDVHGWIYDQDVTFDAANDPAALQQLILDSEPDQNVTVNITLDGSGVVGVGHSGVAHMDIRDGRQLNSTRGYIGYFSGSEGHVTVDGPDSTWNCGDGVKVGIGGQGFLQITHGGQVNCGEGLIGETLDSAGQVTVDGAGSTWHCTSHIIVGHFGMGYLHITDGGHVISDSGLSVAGNGIYNGERSSGVVTVDGLGSLLSTTEYCVGGFGDGTLIITGGAQVYSTLAYVAAESGTTGQITISGEGSAWINSGEMAVGGDFDGWGGDATIQINDGARLEVGSELRIYYSRYLELHNATLMAESINDNGWISATGSDNDVHGDLILNGFGNLAVFGEGSSLTMHDSVDCQYGCYITADAGAAINFLGPVSGLGTFMGQGLVHFQGGYSPGQSPAAVDFEGDVAFATTNTLTIELGGLIAGDDHDQVNVAGIATLDGVLDLVLTQDFLPTLGDTFTILTAASVVGDFAAIHGLALSNGLSLAVTCSSTAVTATAACPGDANLDGRVNLADLQILGDNWQNTFACWSLADFTGDGNVNLADLQILGDNWGYGVSTDLAFEDALLQTGLQVPEPGAMAIVLLSLCVCCGQRKAR